MNAKQKQILEYRSLPKGYYHFCTDGKFGGRLFHNNQEYAYGMCTIALLTLKYDVQIISFELMPNHIHIIIYGSGAECLDCFYYIVERVNNKLKADGMPTLPDNYWFKLIPVKDKLSLRKLVIYLARNKYETGSCTPQGHLWGTGYLVYNQFTKYIRGKKVKDMSVRAVRKITGSHITLPPEWEIHPELGILPSSFVRTDIVYELFPSVKDYVTSLVKDYESSASIAESVGEEIEWGKPEIRDIVSQVMLVEYPGKTISFLSKEQKGRLAVQLVSKYHIKTEALADVLGLPDYVIKQFLNSKDYGIRK